jgi:hypothetical protein
MMLLSYPPPEFQLGSDADRAAAPEKLAKLIVPLVGIATDVAFAVPDGTNPAPA